MKKPKIKATRNKAEIVEVTRQKLLSQYGDLQLQKEAHAIHIQKINEQQAKIRVKMSKLKG